MFARFGVEGSDSCFIGRTVKFAAVFIGFLAGEGNTFPTRYLEQVAELPEPCPTTELDLPTAVTTSSAKPLNPEPYPKRNYEYPFRD